MTTRQYRSASDCVGKKFGRLTVLRVERIGGKAKGICRCECGGEAAVQVNKLLDSHTRSCGCIRREETRLRSTTHGQTGTRTYRIWRAMIGRCQNANSDDYEYYGGRGIRVCERWLDYVNFLSDMGERPGKMEIDRIDNDGNYEPDNCRWASRTTQNRNSRHARMITYNGKTQCVSAWAEELGMSYVQLSHRLCRGMTVEVAFTRPSGRWPKS